MKVTANHEINRGVRNPAKHPLSPAGSVTGRLLGTAVLLLALSGILAISGCTGATSAPKLTQAQTNSGPAAISMAPMAITFGSVSIGGTVSQSVTLSNSGGSDLTVTQVTTAASGLTITGATFPMTIPAGGQSNFNVVFSPKATGSLSGAVSVMSSVSTAPGSVTVSGTAIPATTLLNAGVSSVSFGSVTAGTSGTQSVKLSNAGNSNVTISNVSVVGAGVTTSGVTVGMILAPGQSASLNVIYSPLASGSLAGSVTIASNASNSPDSISLSGTASQTAAHSVTLSWAASPSAGVAGYNVYRSAVSDGPYVKQNSSAIAAMQYTDSTVQSGQTYFYELTSVTSGGTESVNSNDVAASIPAN